MRISISPVFLFSRILVCFCPIASGSALEDIFREGTERVADVAGLPGPGSNLRQSG
jgi:hypothetical protein